MAKRETVEEFLARGGTITKCPSVPVPAEEDHRVNPTSTTGATMMTLGEGALYYSESKARKERKKIVEKPINFAVLPASLQKYLPKNNLV